MSPATGDAVLLLAFNRPDSLARVIDAVRVARPPRVYLAVDGPRPAKDERAAVGACQELVGAIDWGAEVHTLFRESNLGCGRGVSSAISWFFENEERGIILEDDVIPEPAFFDFSGSLLDRYADDPRVFSIAGSSHVPRSNVSQPSPYRFSRYPYVWGWATWRRSWATYRFDIAGWQTDLPMNELVRRCGGSWRAALHWRRFLDDCASGRIDTWDGQLTLAALTSRSLTAVPNVNLCDNIGFGPEATHTQRRPAFLAPTSNTTLTSPAPELQIDERADRWTVRHQFGATAPRMAIREARSLTRSFSR